MAYNIQYLQFLARNIENEDTTNVLYRMRYKTFVVTCMSIIEAVFIALLDERNLIPVVEWKEGTHHHKDIDENTIEVSFKRKKVTPTKKKINLDEAIYLIEKNNVLNMTATTYPVIRELQDLRNRLHLDKANELAKSDYNSFSKPIYLISKILVYYIMKNKVVSNETSHLKFLKPKKITS